MFIFKFKLCASPSLMSGSIEIKEIRKGPIPELCEVILSLQTYFNQDVIIQIHIPKPTTPDFGDINFDDVERECLQWAKEHKLYEGDLFKVLQKTHVALLSAVTYPGMPREGAVLITKWLMALFAIDNWVDEDHKKSIPSGEIKLNVTRKLEIFKKIMVGEDWRSVVTEEDTAITKTMAELFQDICAYTRKNGGNMNDFVDSLDKYFSSIVTEKQYKETGKFPSPVFCADLRADSSGAVHAIYAGMVIQGQDPGQLEKVFYNLLSMRRIVAKCVEYSNDILSHYKEFLQLLRSSNSDSSVTLSDVHNHPQLNLIHIRWHDGPANFPSLEKAYVETVKSHNQLISDYFTVKQNLLKELESTSSPNKYNVMKCISILDGWLSQAIWGMMVERYNVGGATCMQAVLLELIIKLQTKAS